VKLNVNFVSIGPLAKGNLGDYWTKYHCAAHHIEKRPTILTPQSIVIALRTSLNHNPVQLAAKAA
jgi:hypothetical protein